MWTSRTSSLSFWDPIPQVLGCRDPITVIFGGQGPCSWWFWGGRTSSQVALGWWIPIWTSRRSSLSFWDPVPGSLGCRDPITVFFGGPPPSRDPLCGRRWTRREQADFYRVASTFGVEFDPEAGRFRWGRFRALAGLEKKTDENLTKFFHGFVAMCRQVCRLPPAPGDGTGWGGDTRWGRGPSREGGGISVGLGASSLWRYGGTCGVEGISMGLRASPWV